MEITKKTLHLNFTDIKNDKAINKSYPFTINVKITDEIAKEVAESLATLINKNISSYSIIEKEIL